MKGGESVPPWVELLLSTQFFTTCSSHLISPRNECNFFCIDCQTPQAAFCYYCRLSHHSSHHVIQIRRSSYHDVVKVSELEDILDISDVQTYVINSSRVVYLTERPQLRSCGVSNIKLSSSQTYKCEICSRTLLDDFRFCSLGCNFTAIKSDNEMNVAQNGIASNGKDVEIGSNDDNTNAGSANEISTDANNYRNEIPSSTRVIRHRRKGIPRRAPFF